MIKLTLEIEEENSFEVGDIITSIVNVNVVELREKPTKAEIKSVNIVKEKINLEDKVQIKNDCRIEKNKKMGVLLDKLLSF